MVRLLASGSAFPIGGLFLCSAWTITGWVDDIGAGPSTLLRITATTARPWTSAWPTRLAAEMRLLDNGTSYDIGNAGDFPLEDEGISPIMPHSCR